MDFIAALNESSVTFIPDLGAYWQGAGGPGYEAVSPTGEIKHFGSRARANEWRVSEVLATLDYRTGIKAAL